MIMLFIKFILKLFLIILTVIILLPLIILSVPFIFIVICAEPTYHSDKSNRGEILFAFFRMPLSIIKSMFGMIDRKK